MYVQFIFESNGPNGISYRESSRMACAQTGECRNCCHLFLSYHFTMLRMNLSKGSDFLEIGNVHFLLVLFITSYIAGGENLINL